MTKESINTNFRTDMQKNQFVSLTFLLPIYFKTLDLNRKILQEAINTKIPEKKHYKQQHKPPFFSINVDLTFCFIDSVNISQNYLFSFFCASLDKHFFAYTFYITRIECFPFIKFLFLFSSLNLNLFKIHV